MNIYLVRHGEAQDDVDHTYGGAADHPLTPRGEAEARNVASQLKTKGITRIYTSPLRRAAASAAIISEVLRVQDVRVVNGLQERNSYGVLSGIPKNHAWELFPLLLKPGEVRSGYDKTALLGAEEFRDFLARVGCAFADVVAEADRDGVDDIALVSHGTFLRALVTERLGLTLSNDWSHASVLVLKYEPTRASIVGA